MSYDPGTHSRRSIRFTAYDYSRPGAYYVTICTGDKECLFGGIVDGQMQPNEYGKIAHGEWWRSEKIRPRIQLDAWVVMPNHVHGILMIGGGTAVATATAPAAAAAMIGRGTARRAPTIEGFGKPVSGSLPTVIRAYKSAVTKRVNEMRNKPGKAVWQRDYYEHIVRNDAEYARIREYISMNPVRWPSDPENPSRATDAEEDFPWKW